MKIRRQAQHVSYYNNTTLLFYYHLFLTACSRIATAYG